ncbi:MAG: leucine-rich repeat domain-containing protein [Abditibacteriota bacterium]|nr:leucine-rich repeat domain-containing protein [Abditibacteriota bacterium]
MADKFKIISDFIDGRALALKGTKCGIVDASGNILRDFVYTHTEPEDFTVSDEGMITSYKGNNRNLILPPIINNREITAIGPEAFRGCKNIYEITIPHGVTSIKRKAFAYCDNLKRVILPDSLLNIEDWAFFYCNHLKTIRIPDSLMDLGQYAFEACDGLKEIEVSASNQYCVSIGGVLFSKDKKRLFRYPSGREDEEYRVPRGTEAISRTAFYDARVKRVVLPDGLKRIGVGAFRGCRELESINIPSSVTRISGNAFLCCKKLSDIVLPDGLTSIENRAFYYCKSLKSINIPRGVTSICECAFDGCEGLTSVALPDTLEEIGAWAFNGCKSIREIDLPDSVTSIGAWAFAHMDRLQRIRLSSVTLLPEGVLYNAKRLEQLHIPPTVERIGSRAFAGCKKLTEITIPKAVTTLDKRCLDACKALSRIVVEPGNTGYVSDNGILYTADKKKILKFPASREDTVFVIPDTVTCIGAWAFAGCKKLSRITLSKNTETIEEGAFYACSGIYEMLIPASVRTIGKSAFFYCKTLKDLRVEGMDTVIDEWAFFECARLLTVKCRTDSAACGFAARANIACEIID